ncbi:MAG: PQQ-binding-like beta-propeller repeat protein [Myxococcaceae bacterium]|nr:PQQ-binding-like beta-propeller repeat protein [Myxococcaceae bacterium]
MSLALASMAAVFACRDPSLVGAGGALTVEPAHVVFPRAVVGDVSRASVVLTNASRATRMVELEVTGPFAGPPALELGGGESATLELLFLPTSAGNATGQVTFSAERQVTRAGLEGAAVAPISCPAAPAPCRAMQPTPEGTCVEVAAADDSACAAPCVEAGRCRQGQCVGGPRRCDDADACTTDACDEATGCVFVPVHCAAPANPCETAVCEARAGCRVVEVLDGTACGENTCVTAKVCVAGQCREVTAPEGSACAPASPCQAAGTCQQGRCSQPAAAPFVPAWSSLTAPGITLTFPGVADRNGNVYWLESNGTTTELVSVTIDGVPRFRRRSAGVPNPGSTYPVETSPLMLVSDTQLVVLLRDPGTTKVAGHRVEGRSAVDGTLQWSRSRADFAVPLGLAEGVPLWMMSAGVVGSPPRVFLNLRINQGGAAWTSWVAALEPSNGTLLWKHQSTYLSHTIADEDTVYTYEDLWRHELIALAAATGAQRWSLDVTGSAAVPASAFGGRLFTVYPSVVRATATGLVSSSPAMAFWNPRHALAADGRLISADSNSFCSRFLAMYDLATPATPPVVWQSPPGPGATGACLSEPLVTSRQSVLVGSRPLSGLHEVRYDGTTRFSCPLPFAPSGPAVLTRARWVTASSSAGRVDAYDVPVQDVAPRGWVTAGGSLDRANRPAR